MKKIFIYGDSNLCGDNLLGNKIEDKFLWTNMLAEYLGSDYLVIKEGLPGRLAGSVDGEALFKSGKDSFIDIIESYIPVDYIIIALGTNDLTTECNKNAEEIYDSLMWYKESVKKLYSERMINNNPEFIYVLPGNFDYINDARSFYDISREQERNKLIQLFKNNCTDKYVILDNIDLIKSDGMHYSIKGQQQIFDIVKVLF